MLVLAFDTTSSDGSAALFRGLEPLGEVRSGGQGNYSVALFEMVERLLAEAGTTLAEVELFAAATGPGSFTGIRVGLAAAQGWAKAFGRPVCGVSVLEAMIEAAQPASEVAIPLVDARRSEFYLGVFRRDPAGEVGKCRFSLPGEGMVLNASGIAVIAEELAQSGGAEVTFIGRENDQAAVELSKQLAAPARWSTVSSYHATPIARLALRAACEGKVQQPEGLDAWYIRRSDAEVNWRE